MRLRSCLIGAALIVSAGAVQAKPAYVGIAKKAGIKNATCKTCHVAAGKPALNAFGKKVKAAKVGGKVTVASVKKAGKP